MSRQRTQCRHERAKTGLFSDEVTGPAVPLSDFRLSSPAFS